MTEPTRPGPPAAPAPDETRARDTVPPAVAAPRLGEATIERSQTPTRRVLPPRRSQTPLVLAAIVIVLAGFGIALVEAYRLPKGTIWIVVGGAIGLVALIRFLSRR